MQTIEIEQYTRVKRQRESGSMKRDCTLAVARHCIEKLRSAGFIVAMTALGMASAATALMAFQGPPAKPGASPAIRKSQERDSGVIVKALGKPPSPPIVDEAAEERAAEEVGQMRANVEMLELKCESLRSRIHQGILLVDQLEDSLRSQTSLESNRKERELLEGQNREQEDSTLRDGKRILDKPRGNIAAQLSDRPNRPIARRIRKGFFRKDDVRSPSPDRPT